MNAFIENLNVWGREALQFAWPMLWQSSLLIALLFALDFALRRKVRAAIRYALWLVVLVKLALPPSLALPTGLAWWLRPAVTAPAPPPQTTVVVRYGNFIPPPAHEFAAPEVLPPQVESITPLSAGAWLVTVWGSVSAALLAWMGLRWRRIAGSVRHSTTLPARELELDLEELLEEAARAAGVRRKVRLRLTARAMSPAVCGLVRPFVLLPQALVEQLPRAQLRAVLLHELFHLRRGDVWVNCAQALLQIVYWWHPLLWLANARIRRVREEAVDDAVMLALRHDAEAYAPTLVEVARFAWRRPLATLGLVGILESRSALRQRIERLMNFKPPGRAGLSMASVLFVLAFTALAVPMGEAPAGSDTADLNQFSSPAALARRDLLFAADGMLDSTNQPPTLYIAVSADGTYWLGTNALNVAELETTLSLAVLLSTENVSNLVVQVQAEKTAPFASLVRLHELCGRLGITNVQVRTTPAETAPAANSATTSKRHRAWNLNNVPASLDESMKRQLGAGDAKQVQKAIEVLNNLAGAPTTAPRSAPPAPPKQLAVLTADSVNVDVKTGDLVADGNVVIQTGDVVARADQARYKFGPTNAPGSTNLIYTSPARQAIMRKLDRIRIARVDYDHLPLSEVVRHLRDEVQRLDPETPRLDFVINPNPEGPPQSQATIDPVTGQFIQPQAPDTVDINEVIIKLSLTNVRLSDVLNGIVMTANKPIKYSLQNDGIVFAPKRDEAPRLFIRKFKVDPNSFLQGLQSVSGLDLSAVRPTSGVGGTNRGTVVIPRVLVSPGDGGLSTGGGPRFVTQTNGMGAVQSAVMKFFAAAGVDLRSETGKSVFFSDSRGDLLVRATLQDLDIIEAAVQTLNIAPQQILIKAKFIQIPESFTNLLANWPLPNNAGTGALTMVLAPPATRQFLRDVESLPGAAVLSESAVTTLSGRQAQIQVVELKSIVMSITNGVEQPQPVPLGPTLDVVAYAGPDGDTIQMTVIPSLVEFVGYDDPGPFAIQTTNSSGAVVTAGTPLPRFRVRQASVSITVWDGQTVMISSPPAVDAVRVKDKIPTLGDLPFVGRLFQSETNATPKNNLIILVTPTLVDPAGNRVHPEQE